MGSNKEKGMEKNTLENVESPVVDTSMSEEVTKSEVPTPDGNPKSEDKIKSLEGQISKLQKDLNEARKPLERLQSVLGVEEVESDVDTIDSVTVRLQTLEEKLAEKEAILKKNEYIDGLDQPESIKSFLKKEVEGKGDIEGLVNRKLEALQNLLQSQVKQATDTRPKGIGSGSLQANNMNYVLDHPELFKAK